MIFSASPPVAVTSLYVEPGGWMSPIAWLISGLCGLVEELLELCVGDPPGEEVGVVRGVAHHRQDFAGLGVEDDHRAALEAGLVEAPHQGFLGELLLRRVDREDERAARDRRGLDADDADRASGAVLLDPLRPVCAAELLLVRKLDAGLADPVVREVAGLLELRVALGGEGPGVAHDLRHEGPAEVVAAGLDGHLDPGQGEPVLGDEAGRRLGYLAGDRDRVEARRVAGVEGAVDRGRRRVEEARQALHDLGAPRVREIGGTHAGP